jgi:hypothetical protein
MTDANPDLGSVKRGSAAAGAQAAMCSSRLVAIGVVQLLRRGTGRPRRWTIAETALRRRSRLLSTGLGCGTSEWAGEPYGGSVINVDSLVDVKAIAFSKLP